MIVFQVCMVGAVLISGIVEVVDRYKERRDDRRRAQTSYQAWLRVQAVRKAGRGNVPS